MTALSKPGQTQVATPQSEVASILTVIERMVKDPNVDVMKVEKLFDLQERLLARNAEAAFNEAFASMQPSLPEIEHTGKGNNDKTYAKWEDIHEKVTPILSTHGFGLSFLTSDNGNKIVVTAVLRHKAGHSIKTDISLPSDQSGGKNAVQAVGSSISYGKRYSACALLNIRTRGEDDDGKAASKKTSRVAGGGSARDASREMLDAIERGEEGMEATDHTKDPLWDTLDEGLRECSTRQEVEDWWKRQKATKQRKPHLCKAFRDKVMYAYAADLPEVPA